MVAGKGSQAQARRQPLVVDNGAWQCRMGWAGQRAPAVAFRSVVARCRSKATGAAHVLIGDDAAAELRPHRPRLAAALEFSRAATRSPFSRNVVYHFENQELVLDFGLHHLGAASSLLRLGVLLARCRRRLLVWSCFMLVYVPPLSVNA